MACRCCGYPGMEYGGHHSSRRFRRSV